MCFVTTYMYTYMQNLIINRTIIHTSFQSYFEIFSQQAVNENKIKGFLRAVPNCSGKNAIFLQIR